MEDWEEKPERYDKFKSAEGAHKSFQDFSFSNLPSPRKRKSWDAGVSGRSERTPDFNDYAKRICTDEAPSSLNTRLQKIKETFKKQPNDCESEVKSVKVTSTLTINNASPECNSLEFRSNVSFSPTLISTEVNVPIQTHKFNKSNGTPPFLPNNSKVQTTPLKCTDTESSNLINQTCKSTNIYKNLGHWSVPTDTKLKKNLAQHRLQKLKQFVLSSASATSSPPLIGKSDNINSNISNKPEGDSHHSPLIESIKRNLSKPEQTLHQSPLLNAIKKNSDKPEDGSHQSPLLKVTQKRPNLLEDRPHRPSSLNIVKKSSNMPEDGCYRSPLLKPIKRNLSNTDLEYDPPRKIPRDTQQSPRETKNTTVTSNDPKMGAPDKHWKDDSELAIAQECSKTYKEKMERTASWILSSPTTDKSVVAVKDVSKSSSVWGDFENSTTEEMEWTNAEPDEEIKPPTSFDKKETPSDQPTEKLKDLCIVVDTNIFISNLSKLQDIMNMKVEGPAQPILYIPWMVITELDFMKDGDKNNKLKSNIMTSIKFINKHLKTKNPRLLGQTTEQAQKQPYIGPSQDDKIVSCCLQAAERYETVILLSNDLNLINKACINNIKACSVHEILLKVVSKLKNNTKTQKILHLMSVLCSTIICECAKETYGEIYTKMDMLSSAPWSLYECLKRFHRYWEAIFKERMMKQVTKTVMELMTILKKNKYINDDSEAYTNMVKQCIHLCIFLKDMEDFRGPVDNALSEIQKLGLKGQ